MSKKILGVIGDPIEHSLSPRLHNLVLKKLGLATEYEYRAFRVTPDNLANFVRGASSHSIVGLNVTIPHKQSVLEHLDDLGASAQKIGAVNTICMSQNKLIGHNTDGMGFLVAARANSVRLAKSKVVMLGAGGAAKAVAFALAEADVSQLSLYNRSVEHALALKSQLLQKTRFSNICVHRLDDRECLCDDLSRCDLLINTTPIGMYPYFDESPLVIPDALHSQLTVLDLIYNPSETELIREAQHRGARALNGLDMLIYQALEALRLWLNLENISQIEAQVSLAELRDELHEALGVLA